jgi:hypothetical protein
MMEYTTRPLTTILPSYTVLEDLYLCWNATKLFLARCFNYNTLLVQSQQQQPRDLHENPLCRLGTGRYSFYTLQMAVQDSQIRELTRYGQSPAAADIRAQMTFPSESQGAVPIPHGENWAPAGQILQSWPANCLSGGAPAPMVSRMPELLGMKPLMINPYTGGSSYVWTC